MATNATGAAWETGGSAATRIAAVESATAAVSLLVALSHAHRAGIVCAALAPGHLSFTAPEVLAGGPTTVASDIFAAGALLYVTATGASPYAARQTAAAFESLPVEIARVLLRALHPDPALRYATARDMLKDVLVARERLDRDAPRWDGDRPTLDVIAGSSGPS